MRTTSGTCRRTGSVVAHGAIAKALKTREGTVMSRLYRARNQVAALLDG